MLKTEKSETYGWEAAIRGMRNPMNSWDKSDSYESYDDYPWRSEPYTIGENDFALMMKLIKAGSDHRKFMRQIFVSVDITAPLYWWKEFDTYKIGTVANSCSTMHTIHKKEITLDDFSFETALKNSPDVCRNLVNELEFIRCEYLKPREQLEKEYIKAGLSADDVPEKEVLWETLIQLLPESYNQKRTVTLNYEVLRNMYHARKNHKLKEWHTLCEWIEYLPYSELITERGQT